MNRADQVRHGAGTSGLGGCCDDRPVTESVTVQVTVGRSTPRWTTEAEALAWGQGQVEAAGFTVDEAVPAVIGKSQGGYVWDVAFSVQ
jgi:hypothetical protein